MNRLSIVILLLSWIFNGCSLHEEDTVPFHHNNFDSSATYIFYNKVPQNVNIKMWYLHTRDELELRISSRGSKTVRLEEYSIFPGYPYYADSCKITYEDGVSIVFYPGTDWDKLPISPQTHNDSLYIHYPFRHSQCKVSVSETGDGKQRITCEYEITEEDYEFAKLNGK